MEDEKIKEICSRSPKKILSKEEFYLLYEEGLLGNRPKIWKSYEEIVTSGWKEKVTLRSKSRWGKDLARYRVAIEEIPIVLKEFESKGVPQEKVGYNESLPDDKLIFQGELMKITDSLYFCYSTIKEPMNIALAKEKKTSQGIEVEKLLKENLTDGSYNEIKSLLEEFPTSVIEFAVYECLVGDLPERNAVIFEVRNY